MKSLTAGDGVLLIKVPEDKIDKITGTVSTSHNIAAVPVVF